MRALNQTQAVAFNIDQTYFETNERDLRLTVLFQYGGQSVLHTLNKEQRNFLARTNPTMITTCLTNALRQMAHQEGCHQFADCVVSWKSSFIPFHVVYTIVRSEAKCEHLTSIKNLRTRDAVRIKRALLRYRLTQAEPIRRGSSSSRKVVHGQTSRKSNVFLREKSH